MISLDCNTKVKSIRISYPTTSGISNNTKDHRHHSESHSGGVEKPRSANKNFLSKLKKFELLSRGISSVATDESPPNPDTSSSLNEAGTASSCSSTSNEDSLSSVSPIINQLDVRKNYKIVNSKSFTNKLSEMLHLNKIESSNQNGITKINNTTSNNNCCRLDLRSKSFGCEKDLQIKGLNRTGLNVMNINQSNCTKKTKSGKNQNFSFTIYDILK